MGRGLVVPVYMFMQGGRYTSGIPQGNFPVKVSRREQGLVEVGADDIDFLLGQGEIWTCDVFFKLLDHRFLFHLKLPNISASICTMGNVVQSIKFIFSHPSSFP